MRYADWTLTDKLRGLMLRDTGVVGRIACDDVVGLIDTCSLGSVYLRAALASTEETQENVAEKGHPMQKKTH